MNSLPVTRLQRGRFRFERANVGYSSSCDEDRETGWEIHTARRVTVPSFHQREDFDRPDYKDLLKLCEKYTRYE
jgi:hypothetical protein